MAENAAEDTWQAQLKRTEKNLKEVKNEMKQRPEIVESKIKKSVKRESKSRSSFIGLGEKPKVFEAPSMSDTIYPSLRIAKKVKGFDKIGKTVKIEAKVKISGIEQNEMGDHLKLDVLSIRKAV